MKSWSDGVVESWSVGSRRLAASAQYSNTPVHRQQLRFVSLTLCALLLAVSSTVHGQQPKKVARIGYLSPLSPASDTARIEAFRQRLRELGYIEGETLTIEFRYTEGKIERARELAAELSRIEVDVIVASGDGLVRAARRATAVIPIVMSYGSDPVALGLVASLARPGGECHGLNCSSAGVSWKTVGAS
jgi:putative tryptophan/tyrosine transport system substrate-binding protein